MLMLFSTLRFIVLGWIEEQYIQPSYHFPYYGLEFIQAYSPEFVYGLFLCLLLSTIGIILGFYYRVSIIVFFLVFTYIELIDKTYYLNHYYFVSVMAGILCFIPAHIVCSIDSKRNPSFVAETVPRYYVDIIRCMITIVYVYAGIAKINSEWLLKAMPLSLWLPAQDTFPLIGFIFKERVTAYIFSWGGMLFDCTIPFFLMMKRTRILAFCAVLFFHAMTGYFFQIGVFPLIMSLSVLIFFDANFHKKVLSLFYRPSDYSLGSPYNAHASIPYIFAIILFVQIIVPWRFLLYQGNRFWTEQGYRFGWRVMLMEKSGSATFFVKDAQSGKEGMVINSDFLNRHQEKQMAMQPDMIVQFAHFLGDYYRRKGMMIAAVRAEVYATLNGRPSRLLIDPNINLLECSDDFSEKQWIYHYND
jgi:hypothetical protein